MNNDWRTELEEKNYDVYLRLCECRNTRNDIVIMSKYVKKYNPNVSAEDCLIYMLEWVGDLNGQYSTTDLTEEEYAEMLKKVEKVLDKAYKTWYN